ncbi:MAG: type VI secretion system protein TssA [Caenibius sp.]
MKLDVASLVAPLSEDAPSGPDLSYDEERSRIETAFDRSVSDGGSSADGDKDWKGTIELILAQAGRTRDLWLPVYLMRAAALSRNFALLLDGAELLAALLEERWADVHPQLEDIGFIGRKAPCESLVSKGDFLNPLVQIPLIEDSRLGRYCGADFERFLDQGTSADGHGQFLALARAKADELADLADRLEGFHKAIRRVDTVMTANAEGDTATNFKPLYDALERLHRAVAACLPEKRQASEAVSEIAKGSGQEVTQAMSSAPQQSGAINSREDVARALDAITDYYARNEPTSPVPFVLRRAREWISLDFMAVLEDIAPSSVDEANRVLKSELGKGASDSWGQGASAASPVEARGVEAQEENAGQAADEW